MEILDKCEKLAKTSENSPFPFVEINVNFKTISNQIEIPNAEDRIVRGEDGFG